MATPSMSISAPPAAGPQQPPDATPSMPTGASPAQAQPSTSSALSSKAIEIVAELRALAQASPKAVPAVRKINDIIQGELMPALMQDQPPGEPQAPPT